MTDPARSAGAAAAGGVGKNDPFFIPPGAEAYRQDLPKSEIHFLDTGHVALETHHAEIASLMRAFLAAHA